MTRGFRGATEVGCACVTVPGESGCSCKVIVTDAAGESHTVQLGDNFANSNVAFAAGAAWARSNTGIDLVPTIAGA